MPFPHSRIHISNLTRLLDLPEPVREHVAYGRLSMGQARALIGARDPERLAREVIDRDLSVRETEKLAREVKAGGAGANAASRARGEPTARSEERRGGKEGVSTCRSGWSASQ